MLNSKFSIRVSILFMTALLFTGCLRSHKDPKGSSVQGTTDFRVNTITGESTPNSGENSWKVATSKTYEFQACLIGRSTNNQLSSGQSFTIETPDGIQYKDEDGTDDLGCIYWKETIPFNFAADSSYIELKRTVVGTGTHQGEYEVVIGVNPWAEYRGDSVLEVIDMTRRKLINKDQMITEDQMKQGQFGILRSNDGQNEKRQLLIQEKPNIDILDDRRAIEGRLVTIKFTTNPFIQPLNFNDEPKKYNFTKGKFRVYAQLVMTQAGPAHDIMSQILTPELLPQEIEIRNDGTLIFEHQTRLITDLTSGRLSLALKIEPINSPFPLKAFEGLYRVGTGDRRGMFGNKNLTQTRGDEYSNLAFEYGPFIKDSDNFDKLKEYGFIHKYPTLRFTPLQPRFIRLASGETATQRTIIFETSTTVVDPITGDPIVPKHPFKIKRSGTGEVIQTETLPGGILRWTDELTHLYYAKIQYFFPEPEIIHVETGDVFKRRLAINPWDEGWTFGKDTEGLEVDFREAAQREQRPPMFIVDAFRYQTIRFRYVIDKYLTLNVKKAVVMTFDPLVQRFGIQKDRYFEPLRDGIYLMKFALVKYYIDPFKNKTYLNKKTRRGSDQSYFEFKTTKNGEQIKDQFTTVVKKLVRVQGGRITTPVEFSMRDLRMMSIRNNLIVEIATIDEHELLRDNLANEELKEIEADYERYNDPNTTEEEKEEILTQRFELLKANSEELNANIMEELAEAQKEREFISSPYFESERFEKLDELKENLSSERLTTQNLKENHVDFQNYKATMQLKKEEFTARMNSIRSNMFQMDDQMTEYWSEWSDAYLGALEENDERIAESFNLEDNMETIKQASAEGYVEGLGTFDEKENLGLPVVPKENRYARVTYYDYLASMQIFLKESAVGAGISMNDLERLKINNYTQNPATPLINLDKYRNDAGLTPRSFIGPCTLVEDDNMSDMRPTDTLDEADSGRMDSSEVLYRSEEFEIDNSAFENSAYHDSLSPFKVDLEKVDAGYRKAPEDRVEGEISLLDKYIGEHIKNEEKYSMRMAAVAQMGNFTKNYNLNYVSLTDEQLMSFDNEKGCTFEGESDESMSQRVRECLVENKEDQIKKETFLKGFNDFDTWKALKLYFNFNPLSKLKRENNDVKANGFDENLFSRSVDAIKSIFGSGYHPIDEVVNEDESFYGFNERREEEGTGPYWNYLIDAQSFVEDQLGGNLPAAKDTDIQSWLNSGLENFKLTHALKICHLLSKQVTADLIKAKRKEPSVGMASIDADEIYNKLYLPCIKQVKYMPITGETYPGAFTFDRRYRIVEPGEYRHISGKSMNINVGADIVLANYNDYGTAASLGGNGALLGFGALALAKVNPLLGGIVGATGGLLIASKASTNATGMNDSFSTSISEAVFLVVQKAEMGFTIKKHEKCFITQFNSEFVGAMGNELSIKLGLIDTSAHSNALTRGIMICSGVVDDKEIEVIENYYYVTQHFTAGDMLDKANLLNHVWLLGLRGTRDYNNFLRILKAKTKTKWGLTAKKTRDLYEYPLSHLNKVYQAVTPSFPGMYSVPQACNLNAGDEEACEATKTVDAN